MTLQRKTKKISIAISERPVTKKDWEAFTINYLKVKTSCNQLEKYLKKGYAIGFDYKLTPEEKKDVKKEKRDIIKSFETNPDEIFYYRDKRYFKGTEVLVFDIDEKITFRELEKRETDRAKYIRKIAYLVHSSPSHKIKGNGDRMHLIIYLPYKVSNWLELKEIHKTFKKEIPEIDSGQQLAGGYKGCGKNKEVITFGNRLTEKELNKVLEKHKPKKQYLKPKKRKKKPTKNTKVSKAQGKYAQEVVTDCLKRIFNSSRGARNTTLNKQSYEIGRYIHYLKKSKNEIRDLIIQTALTKKGSGFNKREIERTTKGGLEAGIRKPAIIDIQVQQRLWKNKPFDYATQQPRDLMNPLRKNTEIILSLKDKKEKLKHIKSQLIPNAGQEIQAVYVLKTLENSDLQKYYMGLWEFANELKKTRFYGIEVNDILACMYEDNFKNRNKYYEREKLLKVINVLAHITRDIVKDEIETVKPILTYEKYIQEKKKLRFLELYVPPKNMAIYYGKSIFNLDGNDFGFAYQLYTNINRHEQCKKISDTQYTKPNFKKTTLKWDREFTYNLAGLGKTYKTNSTVAKNKLKERIEKLKEHNIIKEAVYKKSEKKFHFTLENPKKPSKITK